MKTKLLSIIAIVAVAIVVNAGEVQIKDYKPFTYAYLECSGSFEQIPAKIGEFMGLFFPQQLIPAGSLFGIYFNSPDQVKPEELKWAIAFPIDSKASVKEPLKKAEFKNDKVAYYLYIGSYEKVGDVYGKVFKFIAEKGYMVAGPVMENYLDDPNTTPAEKVRTEIIVPITK
jgi:effector-binding domain-containing protein